MLGVCLSAIFASDAVVSSAFAAPLAQAYVQPAIVLALCVLAGLGTVLLLMLAHQPTQGRDRPHPQPAFWRR